MPRNGSGTYSLYTPGNPVVTGTTISSTWANNTLTDIGTALTNSLAKDGQTTPTANLPMGNFKLTGLGTGSASTDSLNLGQAQAEAYLLIGSVSGTDTITGSLNPAITAYSAGQTFRFIAANTNTGAVTININSLGAKAITKNGTTALVAGDLTANAAYQIIYDGTQFQLTGPRFNGGTITSDVTMSSATMIWSKGADVASAAALPLITDGNYFDVTGTTTITSMASMGVGTWITLQFDGALTLTHNATDLILPGGANILTAAGDTATFIEYASGDWVCLNYQRGGGIGVNVREVAAVTLSGTIVNISTAIPSWAKEITGMLVAASSNGTDSFTVQLGDAGGFENTGYTGTVQSSGTTLQYGNAFDLMTSSVAAGNYGGLFQLSKVPGTNTWVFSSNIGRGDAAVSFHGGGYKTLSDTMTQLRVLTRSGTDSYDGGTCSLLIKG